MNIIIDGYNFIGRYSGLIGDIEAKRDALINLLCEYRALKRHEITVVFDGWQNGMPVESTNVVRGVKVVYSRLGEKADDVIKRLTVDGRNLIVVSSDREVSSYAINRGVVAISCGEFEKKLMELTHTGQADFDAVDKDDENYIKNITTRKKGNPRRPSKEERRKRIRMSKM